MKKRSTKSGNDRGHNGLNGRKYPRVSRAKVFKKTGRIIANPLIDKDNDYF